MVIRPGHYRIFKNKNQKIKDENIPNLNLDDYIKLIIEPIMKKSKVGFMAVSKEYFGKKDNTIRKLSNIGYRLLNFIIYSHLFYGCCTGKLQKEKLNEYLVENCDIINIIETNWNLLKELLLEKNIDSVQIFINMIFKDLLN